MPKSHRHLLRVYYEDTDFSGFVYHASYLKFLERGRTEFLRGLGIVQHTLFGGGIAFVVSRIALSYLKPAVMDDTLVVSTTLRNLKGASMVLGQDIARGGTCLLRAEVVVAAVRDGRATRLPAALRSALAAADPEGDDMRALQPEGRHTIEDLAARHVFAPAVVQVLAEAIERGGGAQAQFSHPDLGGLGQWSRGGMVMIGDMFNQALKGRVEALCADLANAMPAHGPVTAAPAVEESGAGTWWPPTLGAPAASGSQNGAGYACFPQARRLAIRREGRVTLYDTGDHAINGVSQQQGGGSDDLVFTSQRGAVRLHDLSPADEAPEPAPAPDASQGAREPGGASPAAGHGDIVAAIEALHGLFQKGILGDAEYREKKRELLGRL